MSSFLFPIDAEGIAFCNEIALEMMTQFGIELSEAITRINRDFRNVQLLGSEHPIYHEDPDYWAKDIYYGHDSCWWQAGAERKPRPLAD